MGNVVGAALDPTRTRHDHRSEARQSSQVSTRVAADRSMTPRTWSYGEVEGFGQQGFAMRDHVTSPEDDHRGAERVDLGERIGSGPKNWQRSDERVRDEVCAMLAEDDWVDARDLEVVVHHREVTLAGSVPDPRQRARAVAIAEAVRGVVEVVSRIRVRR